MNKIIPKTELEIQEMVRVGEIASDLLMYLTDLCEFHVEGLTTNLINHAAKTYLESLHGDLVHAPYGYHGFPKHICTSVNSVACHGIPNDIPLQKGDEISIDITLKTPRGYHADCCWSTTCFMKDSPIHEDSWHVFFKTCQSIKPGMKYKEIGECIYHEAKLKMLNVVSDYCGHGIGKEFHEPNLCIMHVPNKDERIIEPGHTFTIEPIFTYGNPKVEIANDGWTVRTIDNSNCSQFEDTFVVTENGLRALT